MCCRWQYSILYYGAVRCCRPCATKLLFCTRLYYSRALINRLVTLSVIIMKILKSTTTSTCCRREQLSATGDEQLAVSKERGIWWLRWVVMWNSLMYYFEVWLIYTSIQVFIFIWCGSFRLLIYSQGSFYRRVLFLRYTNLQKNARWKLIWVFTAWWVRAIDSLEGCVNRTMHRYLSVCCCFSDSKNNTNTGVCCGWRSAWPVRRSRGRQKFVGCFCFWNLPIEWRYWR